MILAALLFISRVAATTTVSQVTDDYIEDGRVHILQDKDIPYYAENPPRTWELLGRFGSLRVFRTSGPPSPGAESRRAGSQ